MRIKPSPGLKVRDHVTHQLLPAEGIDIVDTAGVANDPYWRRLIRDKDVEVVPPAAPGSAPEPAKIAIEAPERHVDEDHPEADQPAHGS